MTQAAVCPMSQLTTNVDPRESLLSRIITAAGVSSGIDMALRLADLLVDSTAAQAMQLMIEYDPQPPFDAGSVPKVDAAVMERALEYSKKRD